MPDDQMMDLVYAEEIPENNPATDPPDEVPQVMYDPSSVEDDRQTLPEEQEPEEEGTYTSEEDSETVIDETEQGQKAGFWVRFFARRIDRVIAGILSAAVIWSLSAGNGRWLNEKVFFWFPGWSLVTWTVFKIYHIFTTCMFGASPGKRLLNLRVVSTVGEDTTLWQIVFRETFGKLLSALTLGVGYMMVLDDKGTLHDRLADTSVIYTFK